MSSDKAETFEPQSLPLKRINRSHFNHALLQAKKALHQFQEFLNSIPKPQTLLASLLATESLAALESQKILLSLEDFFLLSLIDFHEKKENLLPVYYHHALKKACRLAQKKILDKKMLCSIHQIVKKGAPRHMQVGDYRTKQNWIGPEKCKKQEAYFFPPSPKTMRSFMKNLLHYCKKQEKDPLIQIAITIAQFLILHPFMDGNGRVARILIPLLFYEKKILPYPLLFFSRYLKDHRAKYFQNLFDITGDNKWEQWIQFFLKGIVHQIKKERETAEKIYALYLKLKEKLSAHYSQLTFLSYLFSQPVFSRSTFIQRYSKNTLKNLEALNIIKPLKKNHYTFPALLEILKQKTPKDKTFEVKS